MNVAMHRWVRTTGAAALLLATAAPALAQSAAATFDINGTTLDATPWQLKAARGKVVMVFYFSTTCPVCLHKMPELRANAAGWRSKPFELVFVALDKDRNDAMSYASTVRQVEPSAVRFATLWAGDAGFKDTLPERPKRLPLTLVIDVEGQVKARHEGRIALEAWDDVAELIP